ncbi:hypothetical protein DQ04_00391050 [Trypanosoma grayi]|uniref:hypothetical protein n=1 Tax=Trypanosoma grayi TaxID=71804 RepID=UPI0004F3F99B|nr:hypothetical protein DQ04_00391050 [Trypanosoma grayi]KEG14583.1 hypothetical protein DQ04_00391050 [Trypanosoma grayi]
MPGQAGTSPSSSRRNAAPVSRPRPRQDAPLLYDTTVRSSQDSRPVMVRVPLHTPSRGEAEGDDAADDSSHLLATQLRYRPLAVEEHASSSKMNTMRRVAEGGVGRGGAPLTSPAPRSPWRPPPEENSAPLVQRHNRTATPTQPAGLRRSSSALLVSPRPSPPPRGRRRMKDHGRDLSIATPQPFVEVDLQHSNSSGGGSGAECVAVGDVLLAVPPRCRVISPLQHLLIYDNDAQYQIEKAPEYHGAAAVHNRCVAVRLSGGRDTSLHPPTEWPQMPLAAPVAALRPVSDAGRMSPTSLQFSLPRDDEENDSSTMSTLASELQTSNRPRHLGSRASSTRYSVVKSLVRGNEGWSSSEEETAASTNTHDGCVTAQLTQHGSSASSRKAVPTSSGATIGSRRLRTSHTPHTASSEPLTSGSSRSRPLVPAKEEIMREFHELQLQKEALVLMEYEEKDRRGITDAYLDAMRVLLVEHTFRRSILFARDEGILASPPRRRSKKNASSETSATARMCNSQNAAPKNTRRSRAHNSAESNILSSTPERTPRAGGVSVDREKEKELSFSPTVGNVALSDPKQRQQQRLQGTFVKHSDIRSVGVGDPSKDVISSYKKVDKDVDTLQRVMHHLETRILRLFSDELRHRQHVVEVEGAGFHYLLRYHRIVDAALQPAAIYLHEGCQWQSILTEATNGLHRLQCVRLEMELEQELQSARIFAQRVEALVKEENSTRRNGLLRLETEERQQLSRLFHIGVAALLELQTCNRRRHERQVESQIEVLLLDEMKGRETIKIEDMQCRGVLYHRSEAERPVNSSRHTNSPAIVQGGKGTTSGDVVTEISAIVGGNDDCSYITDAEVHHPIHPQTGTTNTTTVSTLHSVNTRDAVHAAVGENSSIISGHRDRDSSSKIPLVEREFFEWNPTSNTVPSTTNNTTTGTTTAGVGARSSLHNSSVGDTGKLHTPSPLPRSVPFPAAATATTTTTTTTNTTTVTTVSSAVSSRLLDASLLQQCGRDQTLLVNSCIDASAEPLLIGVDMSAEIPDSGDSAPASKAVLSGRSQKSSHRNVGVMVDFHHFYDRQGASKNHTPPPNRHLIPCSLKSRQSCKERQWISSPHSSGNRRGDRQQSVSCGTQLTPPTKRPYRDEIIFDRAPQRSSARAVGHYDGDEENASLLENNMPSSATVSSSDSSSMSSSRRNRHRDWQHHPPYGTEGEAGSEVFDSVEEVEDVDDWSQTAAGEDHIEETNYEEEEEQVTDRPPDHLAPLGDTADSAAVATKRTVTASPEMAHRESVTIPDFSLSTMLEATAAGSVDGGDNVVRGKRQVTGAANLDLKARGTSSVSSCCHSVSDSTGLNTMYNNDNDKNENTLRGNSCRSLVEAEQTHSPQPSIGGESYHCPPPNYMRPTTSWRRQHEELEWGPRMCSSKSRGRSVTATQSVPHSMHRKLRHNEARVHCATRIPFEEGPGVWGDMELRRRPFGYDKLGDRAYEAGDGPQQFSPVTTTVCSTRRRQDAAWRFMAEGSVGTCTSASRRSASRHTAATEEENIADPETLASLRGILERRVSSPRASSATTNARAGASVSREICKMSPDRRPRPMTPSYVDAFYKLNHETAGRRRFLAALCHGPVLRDSPRSAAASTTPHRKHSQHSQRYCKCTSDLGTNLALSPGTSRRSCSRSSWSPQPKPWR